MTLSPGQQLDALAQEVANLRGDLTDLSNAANLRFAEIATAVDALIGNYEPPPVVNPDPPKPPPPPTPAPAPSTGRIIPGSGWTGPTPTPPQIGNVTERAIAHWRHVPHTQVEHDAPIYVRAYHLDGIDRVEMSVNNGPWARATASGSVYFTKIDLSGFVGDAVEVRAIVYPIKGKPYVVKTLEGDQGLRLYTSPKDTVVDLGPGRHQIYRRPLPKEGWLVYRGVEGTIIDDIERGWHSGRLKFESVKIELGSGGSELAGRWSSRKDNQFVWFENCDIEGNGPQDTTHWLAKFWNTVYCTYSNISRMQNVFDTGHTFVLNTRFHDIYEDIIRVDGYYEGLSIRDHDRSPASTSYHPDILQDQNLEDTIVFNLAATDNVYAQGIFPRNVTDVVLDEVYINSQDDYKPMQIMGDVGNTLIQYSTFKGGTPLLRGGVIPGERLVVDNCPDIDWPEAETR